MLNRIAADCDLSTTQLRLLGILRDREPEMKVLAICLELAKSTVTGLVTRAERRQLVSRRSDPEDGRAVRVVLTPRGREVTRELEERLAADMTILIAPLDAAERSQLSRLLRRVVETASVSAGATLHR
jgi:DNA-binding MarR family transcriptional regulator